MTKKPSILAKAKTKIRTAMAEAKSTVEEIKTEIKKAREFNKNLKIIKSKNYVAAYYVADGIFYLRTIDRITKKPAIPELINIYEDIKTIARKNNCSQIMTRSWMLALHPKLKERLGFKTVNPELEKEFIRHFENLLIKKVIKIDTFNEKIKILTTEGKKKKFYITIEDFPEYTLPLWY